MNANRENTTFFCKTRNEETYWLFLIYKYLKPNRLLSNEKDYSSYNQKYKNMIFYFTGNGNSKWVAEKIANETNDRIFNISDFIKGNQPLPDIKSDDKVGIIFPTHSWYVPLPVVDFVKTIEVPRDAYTYAICTCGDNMGKGMKLFAKQIKLDAAWSVRMPNTYIPMFNLDSDEVMRDKINDAGTRIHQIANAINLHKKEWDVLEGMLPRIKTYIVYPLFAKYSIKASKFHLEGECIGCNTCGNICPTGNIEMQKGRPTWADKCVSCMGCVNACPQHIIQYGKSTRKRGRYSLAKVLKELSIK